MGNKVVKMKNVNGQKRISVEMPEDLVAFLVTDAFIILAVDFEKREVGGVSYGKDKKISEKMQNIFNAIQDKIKSGEIEIEE